MGIAKKPPSPQLHQRLKMVEEFATLDREIAAFKHKISRHEKLRSYILDWNKDLAPDAERTIQSKSCDIIITSRDLVRSVTPEGKKALFKLWGTAGFIAKANVLLKTLPDPKDPGGLYTVQAPIGPRHLRVVERAQKAVSSAA